MSEHRIVVPNSINSFIVDEMRERLGKGITVRIAFGATV